MTTNDNNDTFSDMGQVYQEKVCQAVMQDQRFAEQVQDILHPRFFNLKYLQAIVRKFYEHKRSFKTFPSMDLVEIMVRDDDDVNDLIKRQVKEYLDRSREHPLNGDSGYIQASSLEFCRRQTLKEAILQSLDRIEESDYDSVSRIIKDALNKGASQDVGHDYMEGFQARGERSVRKPIPTGWPIIDRELNGGWERQTLTTFIAPTGAGKSMFLVNVGAAGIANGLDVLYVSCEMADYKIGLRFDSYFSGVEINNVSQHAERVEQEARAKVKGRLFIKEFPTKTATVQTIRAYLERLRSTKNFVPDMIIVDYADLLRGSRQYGEKRHELEGVYEELRALSQESNTVVVTADQTNRSGLNDEIVTLSSIAESYAKATVCDVIMTISRRMEDKQNNTGRLFIAKSRLGRDGVVYPFTLNTATVKVSVLNQSEDPLTTFVESNSNLAQKAAERLGKLTGK